MILRWWLLAVSVAAVAEKKCPPQETILPCQCVVKKEEFQIWCSHSDLPSVMEGLRSIAQYIQEPIDELILENNYLPSLPGRSFHPLLVTRLMFRYNGLERVSSDWLVGLQNSLVELYLVEPDLRSLPHDSLMHLSHLQAVTIQSNRMKRYPTFSGLPKLRYLQLESLSLIEVSPRNFKDLPSLETIHLGKSPRLTRLEAGLFQDLPRLGLVNVSYSGVSWLHPRAISRLPSLTELVLIGNKITDVGMVGRSTRDLPKLETLRLDYNYIDKIPEAAFVDLPSLKKLFLSNNLINELEYGAFHRVPNLRSLDLTKNRVSRIHPESFLQQSGSGLEELSLIDNNINHVMELRSLLDALPRLLFLDMSYNNLEAIPYGALRGHPTLERLHLDFNKISIIDNEALMAMPALRELRLRNNSLSDILDAPLWNLPALKGLDLAGNFFRRVEERLLANLPSLRRLDVSDNNLMMIEPSAFLQTPALEHINISSNVLSTLHPATFRPLRNLYELDLSRNYLIDFVPNLPRGVEYLRLSHNKISELPLLPDLDLPSLKLLDVGHNKIRNLLPNAFRSLPQLKKLNLAKNALAKLEGDSLAGLQRLESLELEGNKIAHIHRNSLQEMTSLRELNLKNNRLEVMFAEIFNATPLLTTLDVSNNKLSEIAAGLFDGTKNLQMIDASNNFLVQLPPNLQGLKKLQTLDLTNNRLRSLHPQTLSSLAGLRELRLARNFIQELKLGAFDNLQHLQTIDLESNELELVEPNAVRSLPSLKSLKISKNRLREIPNFAFNNLPELQVGEMQENQIKIVGNKAFHKVPHLLLLNLSHNHLEDLENAGLKSVKSLEMLDVSNNKISRVVGSNLEKMEWLVELRMNDNRICAVHGAPFDGMPRLRVLTMKNNKMMSLPEQAVLKLKTNIAILDLDGNPLACSCNLLWLQVWLQESSSKGPRCIDGTYLRDVHLSRQDCTPEERNAELVAPGCESELLTAPNAYVTSQMFSPPWMHLRSNLSKHDKNHLAPSPEESEYFYDEYIEYPINETTVSPHYVPGDTPTLYAAPRNKTKGDIPKEVSNSPSSSGFTFFGVPLPSLNLNNLWQNSNVTAERKTAIVNKPRTGARSGSGLPNPPKIESGGFVPVLPGTGGFKPIPNPALKLTSPAPTPESMGHPIPTPTTTTIPPTTALDKKDEISEMSAHVEEVTILPETSTVLYDRREKFFQEIIEELQIDTSTDHPESTTEAQTTTTTTTAPTAKEVVGTPLQALLAPGGLAEYRPAGRSTITKVHSPHVSGTAPLLANLEMEIERGRDDQIVTQAAVETTTNDDTSWYFANYNKKDLESFVGASESVRRNGQIRIVPWGYVVCGLIIITFLV